MRSLKKRGPHVLDDLMTSYFPYRYMLIFAGFFVKCNTLPHTCVQTFKKNFICLVG